MVSGKECPSCDLMNPSSAVRCDCGYDFATGAIKKSYLKGSPVQATRASLEQRLEGRIIDVLIAWSPFVVSLLLRPVLKEIGQVLTNLGTVFAVGYLMLADGLRNGQSYGKSVAKIRVVDAGTGNSCTLWQSLIRQSALCLGLLDLVFIFGSERQRLGDRAPTPSS